ncbi:MAG: hypothetical protein R2706_14825 [Acidimicrobiales bacterium]
MSIDYKARWADHLVPPPSHRDQRPTNQLVSPDMTQQNLMLLFAGALLIGLIGVVIDRLNFPQKKFRPKTIAPDQDGQQRDRTGAHITQFTPDPNLPALSGDNPAPQE